MNYSKFVNKGIVLAIDDMPERYVKLSDMLKGVGLVTVCVQHPISAAAILNSGCVCGVLLDHDMPHWDGQYYANEILPKHKHIPVCISSANPWGADKIEHILLSQGRAPAKISAIRQNAPELWYRWAITNVFPR